MSFPDRASDDQPTTEDGKHELEPFIDSHPFLTSASRTNKQLNLVFSVLPSLLAAVFACSSAFFYGQLARQGEADLNSPEWAHPTDFSPSRKYVELDIVTFTGSPVFLENGTFGVPRPGPIRYTGTPSPEVDEAWENLTRGRYFRITKEEAIEAFGNAKDLYWNDMVGGYMAGLDVFHALHCLDRLRKLYWPDYYPEEPNERHYIHREHCVDHIRQMLMCGGDMTLVPTEWTDVLGRNYVQADVPHTCRNWSRLREFVDSRSHNGIDEVPESDEKKHAGHDL